MPGEHRQTIPERQDDSDNPPLLPVIYQDEFRLVRWGGTVHAKDLRKSVWKRLEAQEVIIQAQALLDRNVWIAVIEGIRGVCVVDEQAIATAYMVMEQSTDYYQIMTKSGVMPKLVGGGYLRVSL